MSNKLKFCISTVFTILLLSFLAFGQTTTPNSLPIPVKPVAAPTVSECNLTLKEAPALHGLHLGMTKKEFDALFKSVSKINNTPVSEFILQTQFNSADLRNTKDFAQIEMLRAWFFEGKLYRLTITYNKTTVKWKNSTDFVENFSGEYKLPSKGWISVQFQDQSLLRCKELNIIVIGNTIGLSDMVANQKLRNAEQQKEEKKNKPAKP